MKYSVQLISFVLLTGFLVCCTERIDLELDDSTVKLVVDGAVTTDTAVHTVRLSKTTSYYFSEEPPRVTGAFVTLSSEKGVIQLNETSHGFYQTKADFYGIVGTTYTLNIRLAAPVGGFTNYSASATINNMVELDSIQLWFYPEFSEEGFWEIRGFFQDTPSPDYYRFLVSRNSQLISNSINDWFVTDDKFINGSYANGTAVYYLDQGSEFELLVPGDTVTVELNSLGKEYYGFLQEAQAELRGSNPLFSGPPANVKGNISNGAIGFFAAYSVSRASAKVSY